MVQSQRGAALGYVCARALILRTQTSTASFLVPPDVVACSIACRRSVRMRTSAARVFAQGGTRHCKSRRATPERDSHALSSDQAWAKWVSWVKWKS